MDEIEDLEMIQEMDENDPRRKQMLNEQTLGEHERIQKKIDKIIEEDNDDDITTEIEELAGGDPFSENGGNTSVDSLMEDTPSNYNIANQRYNELENMKNNVKRRLRNQP